MLQFLKLSKTTLFISRGKWISTKLMARSKFLRARIERGGGREYDISGAAGRKERERERDRYSVVDGQFLNANNGGVERGSRG